MFAALESSLIETNSQKATVKGAYHYKSKALPTTKQHTGYPARLIWMAGWPDFLQKVSRQAFNCRRARCKIRSFTNAFYSIFAYYNKNTI
jgi:hypothetical protein